MQVEAALVIDFAVEFCLQADLGLRDFRHLQGDVVHRIFKFLELMQLLAAVSLHLSLNLWGLG